MDNELKNNLSTIAVLLYGILSPYLAQYLNQEQFSALFIAVFGIILIVYSAKNPNTMKIFGNENVAKVETEEDLINEEYGEDVC